MQEEEFPAAGRIISLIAAVFQKDSELKEFDIILSPVDDNTCPVIHIPGEHCVGIKSWCVKPLYKFLYRRLIGSKRENLHRRQTLSLEERQTLESLLSTALLLNPEVACFWNMRRELVLQGHLDRGQELKFASLVSSFKPKTSDVFVYRRWILMYLKGLPEEERNRVLRSEFDAVFKAATDYPNNYNAWNHGLWCLEHATPELKRQVFNSSTSWTITHVSDHSGWQFRQQLLLGVSDLCQGDPCSLCPPWYRQYRQDNCIDSNHMNHFVHELDASSELVRRYPGHEALWYHRRFLVYHLSVRTPRDQLSVSTSSDQLLVQNSPDQIVVPTSPDQLIVPTPPDLRQKLSELERSLSIHADNEVYKVRHLRWMDQLLASLR